MNYVYVFSSVIRATHGPASKTKFTVCFVALWLLKTSLRLERTGVGKCTHIGMNMTSNFV
jgi:hypothetical protein